MASYPKPNEKVRVGELQQAADALKAKADGCRRQAKLASVGFRDQARLAAESSIPAFEGLAKEALRASGHRVESSLDGPAWAKFDALSGYRLGIAKKASGQAVEAAEAMQAYSALAKDEASIGSAMAMAAAEAAWMDSAAKAREAKGASAAASRAFAPCKADFLKFHDGQEDLSPAALDAKHSKVGWTDKLFGTRRAKDAERWAQVKASGLDVPGLRAADAGAASIWKAAEKALAGAEKARAQAAAKQAELAAVRAEACKPRVWIDAGAVVPVSQVHAIAVADPAVMEALVLGMASKMPSAKALGRSCLKGGLAMAALEMAADGLDNEAKNLAAMESNFSSMSAKMLKAKRHSSSNKGSVKFDMADLDAKLDARSAQLASLAAVGPRAAMARIEAMPWSDASATKSFKIEAAQAAGLSKAAGARFGAASAPARAFSAMPRSASSASSGALDSDGSDVVSSWFWYSMLYSNSPVDGSLGIQAGSASIWDSGAAAAASTPAFDFGSVGLSLDSSSWDSGSGSSVDSSSSWDSGGASSFSSCSSSGSSCSSSSGSSCSSSSSSSCSSSSCSSSSSCGSS